MKNLFRIFNVLLILILISVTGAVAVNYLQIWSPGPGKTQVTVDIEPGRSTSDIGDMLSQKGLIKSSFIFRLVSKYTKTGEKLQAGKYTLHTGMSMIEILDALQHGVDAQTYSFTVPEGYTSRQIAFLLKNKGSIDEKEFMDIVKSKKGINFKYSHILKGKTLEGFLFPDTYSVYKDSTPLEIINKMLQQFQDVVPQDSEYLSEKKGLSMYKLIVLASLIEREAKVEDERPIVAAVYYNRIKKDMLLECDATIQFLFDSPKEFLTYKDLEIDSPYNTYLYKGLPPGPIANPGLSSIKAALSPASVTYLYYVVKGNGRHKFSNTYEEHLQAVEEYRKSIENQ